MKKLTEFFLVLLMSFSLFSCDTDNAAPVSSKELTVTASDVADTTAVTTEAPKDEEALAVTPDNLGTPVIDTEDYSFTVTKINTNVEPNGAVTYPLAIDITAENKSSDKEYYFRIGDVSVNGLSAFHDYDYYNEAVPAGGKISDTLTFKYNNVPNEFCNYSSASSCAFIWLTVRDMDGNEEYYKINIYPSGENGANQYKRTAEAADRLAYDADGVKLTYVGTTNDEREMYFYIENNTHSHLSVSVHDVKLNGVECDAGEGLFAVSETVNYDYIFFSKADYKNAGVKSPSDIKTIEATVDLVFKDLGSDFGRRINDITIKIEP